MKKEKIDLDVKPYTLDDLQDDLNNESFGYCVACGLLTSHELRDKNGNWIYCCWDSEDVCKNKIRDTHL